MRRGGGVWRMRVEKGGSVGEIASDDLIGEHGRIAISKL
jgi:hypothetical protein